MTNGKTICLTAKFVSICGKCQSVLVRQIVFPFTRWEGSVFCLLDFLKGYRVSTSGSIKNAPEKQK